MQIIWKQNTRQFGNGLLAYAGKWCVAGVSYDGITRDDAKYAIAVYLPGIKKQQNQISEDAAKLQAESIISYWFEGAEK